MNVYVYVIRAMSEKVCGLPVGHYSYFGPRTEIKTDIFNQVGNTGAASRRQSDALKAPHTMPHPCPHKVLS